MTFGALLYSPSCASNCALIAVLVSILQITIAIHLTSSSSIHISAPLASAHYIYSALLVAPEENHSIHMGTMSVCINYHPFYSLGQNGGLASDLMTQKCTVDDNSSSRCNRYSSAQISHDVL